MKKQKSGKSKTIRTRRDKRHGANKNRGRSYRPLKVKG